MLFNFCFAVLYLDSTLYIFLFTVIVFESLSIVTPSTCCESVYVPSAVFVKGISISCFTILYSDGTLVLFIVNNICSPLVSNVIICPFSSVDLFAVTTLDISPVVIF